MTARTREMRDGSERRTETGRAVSHSRRMMQELRDVQEMQTRQGRPVSHGRGMRDGEIGLPWREMGIGRGGMR